MSQNLSHVRRRHVRVPVDVPVFVFSGPKERARSVARDVSLSGMRLADCETRSPGSRLYLEFVLPNHRDYPVMAIGRVIWSKPARAGGTSAAGVEVVRYFPSARFAVRSFVDGHRRRRINYNLFDE